MASDPSEVRHEPVLASEVTRLLITDTKGAYLDLTVGGGGHLRALALRLDRRARLYGLDADREAVERAARAMQNLPQACRFVRGAFGNLAGLAPRFEEEKFSGILLDLGLSSYQLENERRGFSFRYDGPLDMRFDTSTGQTAADLIESLTREQLTQLIREYGEERQAGRIAAAIVRERQQQMITSTAHLADIVRQITPPRFHNKTLARVFQAFRIAVNHELDQLSAVLPVGLSWLGKGGRLAVIAYHSLEDRIVKRFLQGRARSQRSAPGYFTAPTADAPPELRIITKKPIVPSDEEQAVNPRARSAKLRVGEKL
jgi:16S rRNA (cytosine1402-N4)-methyltransferase